MIHSLTCWKKKFKKETNKGKLFKVSWEEVGRYTVVLNLLVIFLMMYNNHHMLMIISSITSFF